MSTEGALTLVELVPREILESFHRLFRATTGVAMVFTDAEGRPVTEVDDLLQFCGTMVRDAEGKSLCLRRKQWDAPEPTLEDRIRTQHKGSAPLAHRCLGGFRDMAVPIVVEGRTLGFAVFARSLTEAPDIEAFRTMAAQGGMSPETGQAVAERALVMPEEKIAQVAEFLQVVATLVARAAYDTVRAQQVLELERLRDELVHMIVHDLRTPLTSIMGGLQTIQDTEYDDAMVREFVPLSLASAEALLEMVNTLLDINKMESGEMKLELGPVNLRELVAAAVSQVRGLAHERAQELSVSVAADCPTVQADGEKLRRVAVNLLGNAIKFTPDGGHIELSARCDDNRLTLAVADDGPGIPPEYQSRIFEKFGQVENRKAGHNNSTGLGLTFCKMVAEAHGGSIRVESELGKGSAFIVELPLSLSS